MSMADLADLTISKRPDQGPVPTNGLWTSRNPVFLPPFHAPGQHNIPIPTDPSPLSLPREELKLCANDSGDVYLYGGDAGGKSNELYRYSVLNNTLTPLQCWGDCPGSRWGHAMGAAGDVIAIHGGDHGNDRDPDLYLLNLVSREWSRIPKSGRAPGHLYRHAMAVVGTTIFIFGGYNPEETDSNELWAFDLDTLQKAEPTWELVEPSSQARPTARYDCSLVSFNDQLIVFGGAADEHLDRDEYLGDTWCFDTKSRVWSELQCTGDIPSQRAKHTAAVLDDVMYIIGGYDNTGQKLTFIKDCFALKIPNRKWFKLKNTNTTPEARTRHASTCIGTNIFTFGGYLMKGASEEYGIHILDAKYIDNPGLHTSERLGELDTKFQLGVMPVKATPEEESQETERSKRNQIISDILKGPSSKDLLTHLQTADAQIMVDFLADELDSQDILKLNANKRHILHLLSKLAKFAQIFPTSTALSDVECILNNPANNQGGYGFIYKGVFREQAICVKAVHTMELGTDANKMLRAQAGELVLLAHVSHPNVIPLYGAYLSDEEIPRICIVSPWMENGDLLAYIRRKNPDDAEKILLAADSAIGLDYLHEMGIIHADLKAKNVLVSQSQRAMLADFGVSTVLHTNVGTTTASDFGRSELWMAPELHIALAEASTPVPTKESDIWGFACICYEMFTGGIPFFGSYSRFPAQLMMAFAKGRRITPLRPNEESQPVRAQGERWVPLAERCWSFEPSKRPNATEVLQFLTELNVQDNRPPMDKELAAFKAIKDSRTKVEIDYSRVLSIVRSD